MTTPSSPTSITSAAAAAPHAAVHQCMLGVHRQPWMDSCVPTQLLCTETTVVFRSNEFVLGSFSTWPLTHAWLKGDVMATLVCILPSAEWCFSHLLLSVHQAGVPGQMELWNDGAGVAAKYWFSWKALTGQRRRKAGGQTLPADHICQLREGEDLDFQKRKSQGERKVIQINWKATAKKTKSFQIDSSFS